MPLESKRRQNTINNRDWNVSCYCNSKLLKTYTWSGTFILKNGRYRFIFLKTVKEIQASLKCVNNVPWFTWRPLYVQWSSGLHAGLSYLKFASSNPVEAVGFFGRKFLSMPSFGGKVKPSVPWLRFAACKRSLYLPWKSHAVGKIRSAISRPNFPPSPIEVCHVAGRGAPLEMTEETESGAQKARLYGLGASGFQGPLSTPYPTLLSVHSW
jgi:hypothetical protein